MNETRESGPPASRQTLLARQNRDIAWTDLEDRYGVLDVSEVCDLLDAPSPLQVVQSAERGALLAVSHGGRLVFPRYQFVEGLGVATRLGEVLAVFRGNDWAPDPIALWFSSPNGYCNGAEPAAILASNPDLVLQAAQSGSARW